MTDNPRRDFFEVPADPGPGSFGSGMQQWNRTSNALLDLFGAAERAVVAIDEAGSLEVVSGIVAAQTHDDASSSDLNRVSLDVPVGRMIAVVVADAGKTIVARHGQGGDGQLLLVGGADVVMGTQGAMMLLHRVGNDWVEYRSASSVQAGVSGGLNYEIMHEDDFDIETAPTDRLLLVHGDPISGGDIELTDIVHLGGGSSSGANSCGVANLASSAVEEGDSLIFVYRARRGLSGARAISSLNVSEGSGIAIGGFQQFGRIDVTGEGAENMAIEVVTAQVTAKTTGNYGVFINLGTGSPAPENWGQMWDVFLTKGGARLAGAASAKVTVANAIALSPTLAPDFAPLKADDFMLAVAMNWGTAAPGNPAGGDGTQSRTQATVFSSRIWWKKANIAEGVTFSNMTGAASLAMLLILR